MKPFAYYNEHDHNAAAWLRQLIKDGLIADGEVDTRSIEDVLPNELAGFTQCHFFAGIGGWSLALRMSGWSDDKPVWTGSCPCQPFSKAGKGNGADDERHLWPAFHHLIAQCRPTTLFGEQVEAAIKHGWLDLVQSDMEGIGYAFAAAGIPAGGVGTPHIRQRLWFVANGASEQRERDRTTRNRFAELADGSILGNTEHDGHITAALGRSFSESEGKSGLLESERPDAAIELGNASGTRPQRHGEFRNEHDASGRERAQRHGSAPGFWNDCDWIPCRDGKYRPVESASSGLVDGLPDDMGFVSYNGARIVAPTIQKGKARVMRLKGYGNAIVPQVAAEFIKASGL